MKRLSPLRAPTLLSIDQGTTGSTVSLWSPKGEAIASADRDFKQHFPKPGWVEHKPKEILQSVMSALGKLQKSHTQKMRAVAAIGITNQRETVVFWDRQSGEPLGPALVWQDRRTSEMCARLKQQGYEPLVRDRTGLMLDPYFSATKIKWVLDQSSQLRKRAEQGKVICGTIDSYLMWVLSRGEVHQTDVSNASRTLLMNLGTCEWDDDLLKLFGIPRVMLPRIVDSSGPLAVTRGLKGVQDGTPIAGVVGDQQAALLGQACFETGEAKCTFGTGSFLLMNTGARIVKSQSGLLTTAAWRLRGAASPTYALEGGAFVCGAAVQFMRDQLGFIRQSSEIEELASTVKTTDGVEFVPALTGLGAPYWDPDARGVISGLTRGTTRAHIARATLEAMALQNAAILFAMDEDLKAMGESGLKQVKVDGGASANRLLMQMQADYLGVSVLRPRVIESTSLGAAMAAAHGVGLMTSSDDLAGKWKLDKKFTPQISSSARLARLKSWDLAVRRAKFTGSER